MGISVDAQKSRPGSEVENMILSAVSKLNVNDIEGARDELTALLALDSENDAAWYYLAMTAIAGNDIPEAEEYLKMAVSLDPDNFWNLPLICMRSCWRIFQSEANCILT